MNITCFNDLAAYAAGFSQKPVVAVVEAHDDSTVESVLEAASANMISPAFIGNRSRIKAIISKLGCFPGDFNIISSGGSKESIAAAVGLIKDGRACALMKGALDTGQLMRAVLSRENGLMLGARLSVAGFFETSSYHKLFALSDMAINVAPDFECKRTITENAVGMLNALGNACPKVAVLSSVEKINPKLPDTVDADALKRLCEAGKIKNCIIEGPISFDLATDSDAALVKGYKSPVAGDADLLIVPDLISGNILAKCLTGMAGAKTAGTVLGAKVPIILTSRSAAASDKYFSIALAACLGRGAYLEED